MAKNQINFTKMNETTMTQLHTFKECALAVAKEDLRYKKEKNPMLEEREKIISEREKAIKEGMSTDKAIDTFSLVEVDNKLRKAEAEHKAIVEPLNKSMRDTYAFIPENMYDAYVKKIDEHKRGDFLSAIKVFLENLGIENCTQGQISKLAENMSDMFGARYAQSKSIVEKDKFITTMRKAQFNKLFMAVFCDMYIK